MSEPAKLRWYQMHLTSVVLIVLVTGLFQWANFHMRTFVELCNSNRGWFEVYRVENMGWPLVFRYGFKSIGTVSEAEGSSALRQGVYVLPNGQRFVAIESHNYEYTSDYMVPIEGGKFAVNGMLWLATVFFAAWGCEATIRRREAREP